MRALSLSFSPAELNKTYALAIKKNAFLDVTENITGASTGDVVYRSFPRQLQIVNTATVDIEFAIISEAKNSLNQDEEAMFDAFQTAGTNGFGWVKIPSGGSLIIDRLPRAKIISVRSVSGIGATVGVRVDLYPMYGRREIT